MLDREPKVGGRPSVHEPTPRELEWRDTMRLWRESGLNGRLTAGGPWVGL